jgi:tetratricopeptide (TPR) repeat protein
MLHLLRFCGLFIFLIAFSSNLAAQISAGTNSLFYGDSSGVLLSETKDIQELNCDGADAFGNPAFTLRLFPSVRQQIKTKQGNPLTDGIYYCRCVIKYTEGRAYPDPGRLTISLGQITYISGITLYNHGKTDEAGDVFRHAAEAFPSEPTFWMALGAVWYKRSKSGEATDEQRKQFSQKALEAYSKSLVVANDNCQLRDNAIGYIATLYSDLGDEERNREWLLQRTVGNCANSEIKSQTFYAIGVKYWQCAYEISTRYANKRLLSSEPFHTRNFYFKRDKDKFDNCVMNAFRYFEEALAVNPNYAEAWSYKSLLYRERQKSTINRVRHRQYAREAEKAAKRAIDLTARHRVQEKER